MPPYWESFWEGRRRAGQGRARDYRAGAGVGRGGAKDEEEIWRIKYMS